MWFVGLRAADGDTITTTNGGTVCSLYKHSQYYRDYRLGMYWCMAAPMLRMSRCRFMLTSPTQRHYSNHMTFPYLNNRQIATRVRHGNLKELTYSQLQIAGFLFLPGSQYQRDVQAERNGRPEDKQLRDAARQ